MKKIGSIIAMFVLFFSNLNQVLPVSAQTQAAETLSLNCGQQISNFFMSTSQIIYEDWYDRFEGAAFSHFGSNLLKGPYLYEEDSKEYATLYIRVKDPGNLKSFSSISKVGFPGVLRFWYTKESDGYMVYPAGPIECPLATKLENGGPTSDSQYYCDDSNKWPSQFEAKAKNLSEALQNHFGSRLTIQELTRDKVSGVWHLAGLDSDDPWWIQGNLVSDSWWKNVDPHKFPADIWFLVSEKGGIYKIMPFYMFCREA